MVKTIFSGLRSRWTMPSEWRYRTADRIWRAIRAASFSVNTLRAAMRSSNSPPGMYSNTSCTSVSVSKT